MTPETSALAWTPPSKIKLAAIGKNDFGEIESILNPFLVGRLQQAPRRRAERNAGRAASRASSQLSVIG